MPVCGRVTLTLTLQEVAEILNLEEEIDWQPRYNIAPTQQVPVVVKEEDENHLRLFQWGLIPYWAKDPSVGNKMINARAETIDAKPSFRHCFSKQRCLILADGFYEWKREGKTRIPYRFTLSDRKLFGFAGIWDTWKSPDGREIFSCSIITTAPNALMAPLHNRMPVILEQAKERVWLDPFFTDFEYLKSFLKPYPADLMHSYQVSACVNSANHDSRACIEPVIAPASLF